MPELPEVENVIRSLKGKITGKIIKDIVINSPVIINRKIDFVDQVKNKSIKSLERRGKYIIIRLNMGNLLIHLRMTGKLLFNASEGRHTHLKMIFEDESNLLYDDIRKFGRIIYLIDEELEDYLSKKVGLEPSIMNLEEFKANMRKKKGAIKKVLLDQSVIAGIGNIYADEILFASGIHPNSDVRNLYDEDYDILFENIISILERAIIAGGSTIRDYVNGDGSTGDFQNSHLVYGRSGKQCSKCGCELEKMKIAGRTTVYCPVCQKNR